MKYIILNVRSYESKETKECSFFSFVFLRISSLIRDEKTNRMTNRTPVDCRIIQFNQENENAYVYVYMWKI